MVGQGGFSPSLLTYKPSETISQSTVKKFNQTNPFGEIRAKDCIMTHNDQIGFKN